MKYLKQKVDWELYLERKNAIFYVAIFNHAYGSLLKKTTGFGFTHQLYRHKDRFVTFYKSKEELIQEKEHFVRLVKEKDSRLKKWHELGKKHLKEMKKLVDSADELDYEKDYEQIMDKIYPIYLHVTTIPFMVLRAVDKALEEGEEHEEFEKVIELFEEFRKTSLNSLHDTVLDKMWRAASDISDIKDYRDFSFFTPEELGRLFKGERYPDAEEIEKRKQECILYEDDGELFFSYECPLEKIGIAQQNFSEKKSLEGKTAHQGFARGKAKIINKAEDMKKFKDGDIIISINTTPDLMPVLSKCKAIVTDEGGITCHASIISRELKKPCVIGTKFAKKILKEEI